MSSDHHVLRRPGSLEFPDDCPVREYQDEAGRNIEQQDPEFAQISITVGTLYWSPLCLCILFISTMTYPPRDYLLKISVRSVVKPI
jgi:hypothetical protein